MLRIRKSEDRGHADHGWLDTRHTFSFAQYVDPDHMGFRSLRVLNEDRVRAGRGFGTHPHRDMEIVTIVLEGALEHRDSLGNGSVIRPGEVQRMSAGTGILHSEKNASAEEPVWFLQIWILPERDGLEPGYQQTAFGEKTLRNRLSLLGSRDGAEGSVTIHQDVRLLGARLDGGASVVHELDAGRHAWLQVVRGAVSLGDAGLTAGDGAAASDESRLEIVAREPAEILLFDLA
jgi:redox-sensitive bicupin YhaK (pirin superfamily)